MRLLAKDMRALAGRRGVGLALVSLMGGAAVTFFV
jgi:hypothetical protein